MLSTSAYLMAEHDEFHILAEGNTSGDDCVQLTTKCGEGHSFVRKCFSASVYRAEVPAVEHSGSNK